MNIVKRKRNLCTISQYYVKCVHLRSLCVDTQQETAIGDFPGGPVVKTPHFQCRGPGFDPWSGN